MNFLASKKIQIDFNHGGVPVVREKIKNINSTAVYDFQDEEVEDEVFTQAAASDSGRETGSPVQENVSENESQNSEYSSETETDADNETDEDSESQSNSELFISSHNESITKGKKAKS